MKISIISFLLVALAGLSWEHEMPDLTKTSDTILWNSNRCLNWNDFLGEPDTNSKYKAMTYIIVNYDYDITKDSVGTKIECHFLKNLAWSKNKASVSLLKHEQLHFDIGELITRKIRLNASKHVSYSIKETEKFMNDINWRYYHSELDSINAKYDKETDHGTIESKQKEWELKIAKELRKMDAYATTRVVIRRVKKV